jgi:hypothetical protein
LSSDTYIEPSIGGGFVDSLKWNFFRWRNNCVFMVRLSGGVVSRACLLTSQKDDGCPNPAHCPEIHLFLSSLKDLEAFLLILLLLCVSGC